MFLLNYSRQVTLLHVGSLDSRAATPGFAAGIERIQI